MKLFLLLFSSALTIMADSMTVSLKTLGFPGLQVVLATDSSVQAAVATALGDNPALESVDLLPYSFVLQNNTGHRISAYTLCLSFVDAAGNSGGHKRQYFNLELASNGMEIVPGATRVVTPTISLDANRPHTTQAGIGPSGTRALIDRLRSQVAVTVALDLIVLDTGQVIGPDEGNTLSYLQGYIIGEREAASIVKTELVRSSLHEVSDHLKNVAKRLRAQRGNSKSFEAVARADVAERLSRLAESSQEKLLNDEVERILTKPMFILYR